MEKTESSGESSKTTVSSQRRCIKYFSEVSSYVPGSTLQYDTDRTQVLKLKLPALNIGVFGSIGAGKSCFINTAESVISGEYSDRAGENRLAKEGDKCIVEATTAERIKVRVGQKMCLVDNRGFPKKCDETIAEEVVKQCDGTRKFGIFVPEDWNNNPWQLFKDSISGTFRRRSLKQRIHCAILVYSLHDDSEPEEFKIIVDALRKTCGRFPIIVLTCADEVDEDVLHRRWTQFQALHCSRIFAMRNYSIRDSTPRMETDTTVVDILYNCCIISDQVFLQNMEESSCMCC